jgi:hypothetical protein
LTELVKYETACRAIAECKSVDEVLAIHDQAAALKAYAKIAKNKQAEADMAVVRKRAERRLGELMAAQKEAIGVNKGGRPKLGPAEDPVLEEEKPGTLEDAGIDKKLADRARKAAAVPPEQFEEIVEETRQAILEVHEDADRKIEAAAEGKNIPPKSILGSFAALDAHWGAASRETQYKVAAKYPVEMAAAGFDRLNAGQRKAFLAERNLMEKSNATFPVRPNGFRKPASNTDQFGRDRPAPGAMLKGAKH